MSQTATTIQNAAINEAVALGTQPSDVVISYGCAAPYSIGCIASVKVNYVFHPITPIVGLIWKTINMSSTTQLPIEHIGP